MRTGRHTVRDVFCRVCHVVLGWKYVSYVYNIRKPAANQNNAISLPASYRSDTIRSSRLYAPVSQDFAFEPEQKYKEGKYILEREMITEKPESKRDLGKPRIEEIPVRELLARV